MNKHELVIDMDDTTCCFSQYVVEERYNKDFNDSMKWTENKSYWFKDCKKADSTYFQNLLIEKGTFINPKPNENAVEILKKLHDEGFSISIATCPQFHSLHCMKEKFEWIEEYIPFVHDIYMVTEKGRLANSKRILLDDNEKHLFAWQKHGGIAVAYGDFSWSDNWKGLRVNSFDKFYNLIKKLDLKDNGIDTDILKNYYKYKLHGDE